MTKAELVDKLAKNGSTTKKQAAEALAMVFSTIAEELAHGEKISVPGFGSFSVVNRAARSGINPQTKKKIKIKATKAPKFTAAKALKDTVKGIKESSK
ncbi:MAG: HU family DNA-binding protein [Pseudomonadota bacterium]|jgi:DNA-binding protein HU-beta